VKFNWFSKPAPPVEPIAIDRKPTTPTDGVQDPEIQRQLDALRRILDAYCDDAGTIPWEHTKAIREALRELLISPGISQHDFLVVYGVWTTFMDTLRVTAAAHVHAGQLDQARQISETGIDFIHYVINPMQAMPPEEAAAFALDGFTADGRRVWPLLEQHMPEAAENFRLTRLETGRPPGC
jgi:hypothetical protein